MAGGGRLRCRRKGGVAGAKTAPLTCLPQSLLLLLLLLYISPSLSPEALQTSFLCPDKKGTNMKKWTKQNKGKYITEKNSFSPSAARLQKTRCACCAFCCEL